MRFSIVLPLLAVVSTASAEVFPNPEKRPGCGADGWVKSGYWEMITMIPPGPPQYNGVSGGVPASSTAVAGIGGHEGFRPGAGAGFDPGAGSWPESGNGASGGSRPDDPSWAGGGGASGGNRPDDPSWAGGSGVSGGNRPDDPSWAGGTFGGPGQVDANGPLGIATKSSPVKSYGSFTSLPFAPEPNAPWKQRYGNSSMCTSDDAKKNPSAPHGPLHRGNWASGFDINTDPEQSWPDTGVTKQYTFRVQNTTLSPVGTPKPMLVINGQFPGPLVEANWGDWLEVTVINELQNNGTGIHWHGFRQEKTNCEDGVGGITECPIPPGHTKTYKFQATSYGTTWYHSHFSAQYGDGVLGPVVIHGPASANYDIDLGPVVVNDYYNLTVFQEDWFVHRDGPRAAANYLLNGKNIQLDLSAGSRQQWTFQKGKKHLLRFINTSVDMVFKIQIDGHDLTVISNDFVPIQPYTTKELTIAIGQRYEVVVEASQPVENYFLRAIAATDCGTNLNDGLGTANGVISYAGADSSLPATTSVNHTTTCFDETAAGLIPVVQKSVDPTGFAEKYGGLPVNVQRVSLAGGDNVFQWYLNGISQSLDWSNPTIGRAVAGNFTFPPEAHAVTLNDPDVWTFWVIQNQFFVPHPMHLHGHDFHLLGQGNGTFNVDTDMDKLNFENPTRRDVAMLIASGWTVIAFKTSNPGAWLMHCHIAWHAGEGLSLQFVERPDDIPNKYSQIVSSQAYQDNCKAWNEYVNGPVAYNKTDSGLKRRGVDHFDTSGRRMGVTRHLHQPNRRRRQRI